MEWAEANPELVHYVAANVRPSDEEEVMLSHRMTGAEAVLTSWIESDICRVILGDNSTPVGVTGVCDDRIWLLGTTNLTSTTSHRWQLAVHGRQWVEHCLATVGKPIGNYVYAKNHRALRWLKQLGFTVEHPVPYGPSCALFCEFWRAN